MESAKNIPMAMRAARPSDYNFILNSWLTSYCKTRACGNIPTRIYYDNHKKIIDRVLKAGSTLMAVSAEDDDQIYGYVVFDGKTAPGITVVHYTYVKEPFRNFRIARSLWQRMIADTNHNLTMPLVITHTTKNIQALRKTHDSIYNPYLLLELK